MIDIVIATYQRYAELTATLTSVQQQTYTAWHCWIAEDGESRETRECIAPFLTDSRFSYLPGPHAGFPASPRNRAIQAGEAEFIAVLDDDDIWLPEKLEKQLAFLASHPDCVMVGTNAYRWQGGAIPPDPTTLPIYHTKIDQGKIAFEKLLIENCFIVSSAMIRREAINNSGLFNENLHPHIGEDIELWYRLAAVGELWFMAEPLLLYLDLPPNYYNTLTGDELTNWIISILQAALTGNNGKSPLQQAKNKQLAELLLDRINFLKTGPHLLNQTGYKIKKFLGIV